MRFLHTKPVSTAKRMWLCLPELLCCKENKLTHPTEDQQNTLPQRNKVSLYRIIKRFQIDLKYQPPPPWTGTPMTALEDWLFSKAVRCANLITLGGREREVGREKRESDKQSDKLSYSTCKDPHICNNDTFTAAVSRAESSIILQCTQDKAHYILYSFLGRWEPQLLINSNS